MTVFNYQILTFIVLLGGTTSIPSNVVEKEVRDSRIDLCLSEIDRNRTESALEKFQQIKDNHLAVVEIVDFYVENYQNNFLNLIQFLKVLNVKAKEHGYGTLLELIESNRVNVLNVLTLNNFIGNVEWESEILSKLYEDIERKTVVTLKNLNLTEFMTTYASDYESEEKLADFIPMIVEVIYENNPNDIVKLFEFFHFLKSVSHKIKLVRALLITVPYNNVKHLSMIINYQKMLKKRVSNSYFILPENYDALTSMEKDFPNYLTPYMNENNTWAIKNVYNNEYLQPHLSNGSFYELLYTSPPSQRNVSKWRYTGSFFDNSSLFVWSENSAIPKHLSLYKCVHRGSIVFLKAIYPTHPSYKTLLYNLYWTVEVDDKLKFFEIKNSATGEFLSASNEYEPMDDGDGVRKRKVVPSKEANEKTKWFFETYENKPSLDVEEVTNDSEYGQYDELTDYYSSTTTSNYK